MIKNILIHIGYHKTGSTWLQRELFTTSNETFEPFSFSDEGHSTLAEYFFKDREGYLLSSFNDNYPLLQKEIANIKALPHKDFNRKIPVISHERLSGSPHSGGFDAKLISHRIKKVFPEARIFVVIREQKSFILSSYFQYLFNGGKWSFEKYISSKYDGKYPFFSPNHLNYYLLVKHYQDLFGKEKVLVLPYEMLKYEPSLFFEHFENFLNIRMNIDNKKVNTLWNKRNLFYVRYKFRFLNSFRKKNSLNTCHIFSNHLTESSVNIILYMMNKLVPKSTEDKFIMRLYEQLDAYTHDRYKKKNEELSTLINVNLKKYGYY